MALLHLHRQIYRPDILRKAPFFLELADLVINIQFPSSSESRAEEF